MSFRVLKQRVETYRNGLENVAEALDIHPEDIESRSMGAGGEDLIMKLEQQDRDFLIALNVKM